jgi:hypothetical protein
VINPNPSTGGERGGGFVVDRHQKYLAIGQMVESQFEMAISPEWEVISICRVHQWMQN